jgi:hypothetical protein
MLPSPVVLRPSLPMSVNNYSIKAFNDLQDIVEVKFKCQAVRGPPLFLMV